MISLAKNLVFNAIRSGLSVWLCESFPIFPDFVDNFPEFSPIFCVN